MPEAFSLPVLARKPLRVVVYALVLCHRDDVDVGLVGLESSDQLVVLNAVHKMRRGDVRLRLPNLFSIEMSMTQSLNEALHENQADHGFEDHFGFRGNSRACRCALEQAFHEGLCLLEFLCSGVYLDLFRASISMRKALLFGSSTMQSHQIYVSLVVDYRTSFADRV